MAVGETEFGAYTLPSKQRVTIGRSTENDVSINDASISREHAVIHFAGDTVHVEDVGSNNGTRVREASQWSPDLDPETIAAQDRRLETGERVRLMSGSIVMLGTVMLMFQARATRGRPRRLWPHDLFEDRVEEECVQAARDQRRQFAIVHMRLSMATVPTATIDIANRIVHGSKTRGGPHQLAEEVLANIARPSDMISVDEASGEYHILLAPATIAEAEQLVERLETEFEGLGLSVDLGYACCPRDGRSTEALLARASKGKETADPADLLPFLI